MTTINLAMDKWVFTEAVPETGAESEDDKLRVEAQLYIAGCSQISLVEYTFASDFYMVRRVATATSHCHTVATLCC